MSLNWKEIDLILEELKLGDTFIQQAHQPRHYVIILDLHRPGESFSLFISLLAGSCRLHRQTSKIKNPARPQRFAAFLKARLKGAKIVEAVQVGEERIVKLTLKKGDEETLIWIRLWSGAANMVVTDGEGNVLDACYRRKARNEMTGGFFNPENDMESLKKRSSGAKTFEVRDLPGEGDFNDRVRAFYSRLERQEELEKLRNRALSNLDAREAYFTGNLKKLLRQQQEEENCSRFKEIGDILMANMGAPVREERWLRAEDFYHNNEAIDIELDPDLSITANADNYYKRFKKGKAGLERTLEKIEEARHQIEKQQHLREKLLGSTDFELLREVAGDKVPSSGSGSGKRVEAPGLEFWSGKFRLLVGRTSQENDELLRRFVRGNDYWFHCRDYPGGYVFVKSEKGKSIPLDVMLDAGNLALLYSKGKNSGRGDVYYTQVKYLRRPKEGKQGLVLPTQEKNLHIVLDRNRIDAMRKIGDETS